MEPRAGRNEPGDEALREAAAGAEPAADDSHIRVLGEHQPISASQSGGTTQSSSVNATIPPLTRARARLQGVDLPMVGEGR